MKSNPYLTFAGDCEAAFALYATVLGGRVADVTRFRDVPGCERMDGAWRDKVMHSTLEFGDQVLMGSDAPAGMYQAPQGISVALHPERDDEAERIYAALSEGGTVTMELQETFWASRFAMFADRYGTRWIVNCAKTEA